MWNVCRNWSSFFGSYFDYVKCELSKIFIYFWWWNVFFSRKRKYWREINGIRIWFICLCFFLIKFVLNRVILLRSWKSICINR